MRSLLAIQLFLFFGFFLVPQGVLWVLGGQTVLEPIFFVGIALWLACIIIVRNEWIPIQKNSLLQIHPIAKILVMLPYIFLQLLDGLAVFRYGHQILYLASRPSTAQVWLPLKIFSSGAIFLSVICLAQAEKIRNEKLSIVTMCCTMLSGSRGLLFFNLFTIIILRIGWKPLVRLKYVLSGLFLLISFVLVGIFREGQSMDFNRVAYLYVQSLNEFVEANLATPEYHIPPSAVMTQLPSLAAGRIDASRVTYQLTSNVNQSAIEGGYGISSSSFGEWLILFGKMGAGLFFIVPLASAVLLTLLYRSRLRVVKSLSVALLPYIFYAVRAELFSPLIALGKAAIGLLVLLVVNYVVMGIKVPPATQRG